MKFAHDFDQALTKGEYPPQWLDSAISYRQLKKCIKKVQQELLSLGLDTDTLNGLWQSVDGDSTKPLSQGATTSHGDRFRYTFKGNESSFRPTLTFLIDSSDGSPQDCWLSPETREYLMNLPKARSRAGSSSSRDSAESNRVSSDHADRGSSTEHVVNRLPDLHDSAFSPESDTADRHSGLNTVEVPLSSDTVFFHILNRELSNLARLQEREEGRLMDEIETIGKEVQAIANAGKKRLKTEKSDLAAWREIFRLYIESQVFFSTGERNAGIRDASSAQNQLKNFTNELKTQKGLLKLKKTKATLDHFLRLNVEFLQNFKFTEINHLAFAKIMKKFDKRTALHAQRSLPSRLSLDSPVASTMAKAVCCKISESIVTVIPQVGDYLCPICFSISYKPVRLRCQHVFCIRCIIVMQLEWQNRCPLCREKGVMEASADDIDKELKAFLKEKFPKETRRKQRENERANGVDLYGEDFDKCNVM